MIEFQTRSTFSKVFRNLKAFGVNRLLLAVQQLIAVPLLLSCWGDSLYGGFLLLASLPNQFTAVCHLGMSTVAANRMAKHVANGETERANVVFVSTALALMAIGSLVTLCFFTFCGWVNVGAMFQISSLTDRECTLIICLSLSTWATKQLLGMFAAVVRAVGQFDKTIHLATVGSLSEFLIGIGVVVFWAGGNPLHYVATLQVIALVWLCCAWLLVNYYAPAFRANCRLFDFNELVAIVKSSVVFTSIPSTEAFFNHSVIAIIGVVVGPVAVTAFSITRTAANFGRQLTTAFTQSLEPEIATAFGAGDVQKAKRLHEVGVQGALISLSLFGGAMFVVAPYVFPHWTRHIVDLDVMLLSTLLLSQVLHAVWLMSARVLIVQESLKFFALSYIAVAALALTICFCFLDSFGVRVVGLILIGIHAMMIAVVLPRSLRLCKGDVRGLFRLRPLLRRG